MADINFVEDNGQVVEVQVVLEDGRTAIMPVVGTQVAHVNPDVTPDVLTEVVGQLESM